MSQPPSAPFHPLRGLRALPFALGLVLMGHIVPAMAEGNPAIPRDAGNPPARVWEKFATPKADRIVVYKALRQMQLLHGNEVLRTYHVALGRKPYGQKTEAGDGRTPEGRYFIDRRNMFSDYHLALHISYPDTNDIRRAAALGVEPGGSIMIHGLPNGMGSIGSAHRLRDWTAGCIAVTDSEIDEIWKLVPTGTPVEIRP